MKYDFLWSQSSDCNMIGQWSEVTLGMINCLIFLKASSYFVEYINLYSLEALWRLAPLKIMGGLSGLAMFEFIFDTPKDNQERCISGYITYRK